MKHLIKNYALLLALSFIFINGCKKKEDDVVRIQSVVPQNIIDNLLSKGMTINEGTRPPKLDMAIRVNPYHLKSPYGPNDSWREGHIIGDYFYYFYDQNNKNEIKYDYYNSSESDKGVGEGAFIAGDGNKFTIFSEDNGTASNVQYKNITIISGEVTPNGIKNFQYAFVIKEKIGDDNNSVLIAVGAARVWIDGNLMSETIDDFRMSAEDQGDLIKTVQSALSAK